MADKAKDLLIKPMLSVGIEAGRSTARAGGAPLGKASDVAFLGSNIYNDRPGVVGRSSLKLQLENSSVLATVGVLGKAGTYVKEWAPEDYGFDGEVTVLMADLDIKPKAGPIGQAYAWVTRKENHLDKNGVNTHVTLESQGGFLETRPLNLGNFAVKANGYLRDGDLDRPLIAGGVSATKGKLSAEAGYLNGMGDPRLGNDASQVYVGGAYRDNNIDIALRQYFNLQNDNELSNYHNQFQAQAGVNLNKDKTRIYGAVTADQDGKQAGIREAVLGVQQTLDKHTKIMLEGGVINPDGVEEKLPTFKASINRSF